MIKASNPELLLHFAVLESGNDSLANLTNVYSEHLLTCLSSWYGTALYDDPSLAYEAVYQSLRYYSEHPRKYNPEQGCLVRFLELNTDRTMQEIFEREKYSVRPDSIDRHLARFFDNERDVQLAKLILNKVNDVPAFIVLLDLGSYRIAEQLSEIKRHTLRIRKIIEANINIVPAEPKRRKVQANGKRIHAIQ